MIVVISQHNGPSGDDIVSNQKVYDLPVNKAEDVKSLHKRHLYGIMKQNKIMVNPHWPETILVSSEVKNTNLHKNIMNEHNIYSWIEKNWNVQPLEFGTVYE